MDKNKNGKSYYSFNLGHYQFEAIDFINHQKLDFSDGNIFKAICRIASHKNGVEKPNNELKEDYKKIIFYAQNQLNLMEK